MSAYFQNILQQLHKDTRQELATKNIEVPRRGKRELQLINRELKRQLFHKDTTHDKQNS